MAEDNTISRRKTMKLAGAAAVTAVVAGCSDDDDNGNGNGDEADSFEIDPGTEIEFNGQTAGWEGIAPSEIEGAENPTLVLEAGEDYEVGWTEGDGSGHNIEIWDADDNLVDDLETEVVNDPDDDQWLEFTADEEMAYVVCEPHANSMRAELQVE